ncbi:MAG: hypothetical protein AAGC77_14305 [Pseudomonadota bacterium]
MTKGSLVSVLFLSVATIASPTFAQSSYTSPISQTLENTVRDDVASALSALDTGDFYGAAADLRNAADFANRLNLQRVAADVARVSDGFTSEDARFALAASTTVNFENFLNNRGAVERIFKDDKGNVVRVKVFGDDADLQQFSIIAADTAMLDKNGLEREIMLGEPAIKNRGVDGSLSVLMMSEEDHALIEIDGASEAAVMAVIEQIENAAK